MRDSRGAGKIARPLSFGDEHEPTTGLRRGPWLTPGRDFGFSRSRCVDNGEPCQPSVAYCQLTFTDYLESENRNIVHWTVLGGPLLH